MTEPAERAASLPENEELRAPPPASTARRIVRLLITLVVLGGGVVGFMMYKKHAKEKEVAAKKTAETEKKALPTLVRVATSRKARVLRRERYVGELAALRMVELGPKAAGRLVAVKKELGEAVKKGELVATVDPSDIAQQLAEARTAILVAAAQVARAVADQERAEADVERANVEVARNEVEANRKRPLFKQQLVTQQEMDNLDATVAVSKSLAKVAQTAAHVAKSAVLVARAQVVQAQARIPILRVALDNTRVVAPFAGRVNKRYLDPGAMVAAGTPVYQIVTDDNLLARFKVPERDLSELPKGKTVTLHIEAYPKETFEGKVIRVSPSVDVATRTSVAEAETSTHEGKLKPGMFARVDVLWSVLNDVILVQQRALVRPPDDPQGVPGLYVFESGKARFIKVQTGIEEGDDVQVRGISEGATVIVEGQHGLKSGAEVAIAKAPAVAGASPVAVSPPTPAPAP